MNKNYLMGGGILVIIIAGLFFFGIAETKGPIVATSTPMASTSTQPSGNTSNPSGGNSGAPVPKTQYGEVVFHVGGMIPFNYVTLKLLSVFDDSRCPQGVQCIWAGTAKVKLNVYNKSGNYDRDLELGKSFETENEIIEFVALSPSPVAGQPIQESAYRVTLKVTLKSGIKVGGCFVGGCSSQLCSDQPNMASTCEWTESYACYKTAKCERQSNGQCGWTSTSELNMCLSNAQ